MEADRWFPADGLPMSAAFAFLETYVESVDDSVLFPQPAHEV
jgi:hypothetical protein